VEDTLPVGEKGRGALWVVAVEVKVQLVDDVMVHNGIQRSDDPQVTMRRI